MPTAANDGQQRPTQCVLFHFLSFILITTRQRPPHPSLANTSRGWVYSPPPTTHHHHHHHLTTSSTSSTTITGARDVSWAFSFFLFLLFYFIFHRGRDVSRAFVCFILFYFYSFYFTGTEMCQVPSLLAGDYLNSCKIWVK